MNPGNGIMKTNMSTDRWLSIDPGDRNCGVAWWRGTELRQTATYTPDELYEQINGQLVFKQWVVEEFRLYPWKMQEQGMSEMKTPGVIAVIRYIGTHRSGRTVPVVIQPALIKKPTRALMETMGLTNPGRNLHERDAVEHGYHWMFKHTNLLDDLRAAIRKKGASNG